jgi:H2-forming N5,N10-methylenetetrahydromethanopterin dehydrogenase-like enzyme
MLHAFTDYITRKGIKVITAPGERVIEAQFSMAHAMAKAVKKKGIDGTRFYSDVFNDKGFKRLTDVLEEALGQEVEIKIIAELKK